MKRIATAALVAVATLFMAGSALAQDNVAKANIPFSFTVNSSVLPAGTYIISSDSSMSNVISLADRAKGVHILVLSETGPSAWANSSTMVFHKYGEKYFLREIRSADSSTDLRFPMTGAEKRARAEAEEARLDTNQNVTLALNTMP
ncbi:MAG TPA: hypothetical protein VME86_04250 [Acidobacteriaceae bacterium]|nr:hypothetical protein [Acidobacteriaceae bacterium]